MWEADAHYIQELSGINGLKSKLDFVICVTLGLKEQVYKTETDSQRKQTYGYQRE